MKNAIVRILKSVLPVRESDSHALNARSIARRLGRGNVKIQLGRIMTKSEYQVRRSRVLAYDF